jgi:hypothetical protein
VCSEIGGWICLPVIGGAPCVRESPRVHGDPCGIFVATGDPSNESPWCSGRKPFVTVMEPADRHCHVKLAGRAACSILG